VLHYRMGQQREVLWRGHKITKMALMPRYNYIIRILTGNMHSRLLVQYCPGTNSRT